MLIEEGNITSNLSLCMDDNSFVRKSSSVLKSNNNLFVLLSVLLMILSGCDTTVKEDGIIEISPLELTENQEILVKTAGADQYFIFEYSMDELENIRVNCWVEYYRDGIFQDNVVELNHFQSINTGSIMLSKNTIHSNNDEWIISVVEKDSSSQSIGSISSLVNLNNEDIIGIGTTWAGLRSDKKIALNEPLILAIIAREGGDASLGIDLDVFDNDQKALERILNYDYVYIFKAKINYK
ncbi:hypothetical protein KHQ82_07275 [Mycoplasmatota bacterium]|nr:hypothetical protein KHQ82_07275 [Mycoplasmatota bacterium]